MTGFKSLVPGISICLFLFWGTAVLTLNQFNFSFDPPYSHNDVKPGNVLISQIKGQHPVVILMDFGSTCPARKEIRSRSEASQQQADTPSLAFQLLIFGQKHLPLYVLIGMDHQYVLSELGGSLQLAIMNAQIKWASTSEPPYPDTLHQFVIWMLQPQTLQICS
ncbi:hypothetical protein ZIOFF_062276 [Zingiber officinale]|uniref:non-specific serine/threonine protein kinase n=1 Tax=Zingiber officinale TaxID=94328 RepID=A0A8J5F564_ZINOF|nr:hypothetical protein ZIOFF_062276 [Zingiber officinale]